MATGHTGELKARADSEKGVRKRKDGFGQQLMLKKEYGPEDGAPVPAPRNPAAQARGDECPGLPVRLHKGKEPLGRATLLSDVGLGVVVQPRVQHVASGFQVLCCDSIVTVSMVAEKIPQTK